LRRAVTASGKHEVVWVASNGADGVDRCKQDRPDLILMDLNMPIMDGVQATRSIMEQAPCPILIVTSSVSENRDMVFEAMGAGALDAVDTPLSGGSPDAPMVKELLQKIRTIASLTGVCAPPPMQISHGCGIAARRPACPPLVVLGASSGGPQALAAIVRRLPETLAAAVVIVQHLDARFAADLANWLAQQTRLPVTAAVAGDAPRMGEIFVAATDDHLLLSEAATFCYSVEPSRAVYKPSVDAFVDSALKYWDGPLAAALLSGMGRDGAEGLARLRQRGGFTLAQDARTCAVYGMPRAAVELSAAVRVLPPEEIADALSEWVRDQVIPADDLAAADLLAAEEAARAIAVPRVRVLLVDDQLMVHEGFRRMFKDVEDVDLFFCADPSKALQVAEQAQPMVILQDLVMPGMDGLMLLGLLRSNPATKAVPVIVLSTKEDPKIKSEAFAIGASDYLVKFPDRIELLARVRAHARSFVAQEQRDHALRELRALKIELERKNAELEALSCRDGLTGVLNRRGFDDFFSKEWLRAVREHSDLGLLLIDIDHFKGYNDNYGHQEGDECLRRVAFALGASLKRASDVVARYGGEEFAVILPDTGLDGCEAIAESLRATVEGLRLNHAYSSVAAHVTISVGVASVIPAPGQSMQALVRDADRALYQAKAAGRNRCVRAEAITTPV
jgi:two-component system chemotaxis family response regulator WspR